MKVQTSPRMETTAPLKVGKASAGSSASPPGGTRTLSISSVLKLVNGRRSMSISASEASSILSPSSSHDDISWILCRLMRTARISDSESPSSVTVGTSADEPPRCAPGRRSAGRHPAGAGQRARRGLHLPHAPACLRSNEPHRRVAARARRRQRKCRRRTGTGSTAPSNRAPPAWPALSSECYPTRRVAPSWRGGARPSGRPSARRPEPPW